MNVNYDVLKDLKMDEIVAKMSKGEIEPPPPKSKEREDFLNFAREAPGSEFRTNLLNAQSQPAATVTPPEEGAVVEPKTDDAPAVPDVTPSEDSKSVEDEKKTWWEDMGCASEQEGRKILQEQRELVREQKAMIDRYNAERGTIGQRAKLLEEKIKTLEAERKNLAKNPETTKTSFDLKRPVRPKVADFEDGFVDDGYQKALDEYNTKLDEYDSKYMEYNQKLVEKIDALESLKAKVEDVSGYVANSTQQAQQAAVEKEWSSVWGVADTLNQDFGLGMTTKPRDISDAYSVLGSQTASVEQKQQADRFIKTLSEKDRLGYEKVKKVVESYFDFSSGRPVQRLSRIEAAIFDSGLDDLLTKKPTVQLTKEEEKKLYDQKLAEAKNTVSAPSAATLASNGDANLAHQTHDEKLARFKILAEEYAVVANRGEAQAEAFEKSPKFAEYVELRRAMGIKIPSFKRYHSTQ